MSDIVQALRDFETMGAPLAGQAADIIERHRKAFRKECAEIGYDEADTEEMLAQLEAGE